MAAPAQRDRAYDAIEVPGAGVDRIAAMRALSDALWDGLRDRGCSWIGFYLAPGENWTDEDGAERRCGPDEMLLGPHRDRPACSPIGVHGVCGMGWREARPIVVRDVRALGDGYVACDPRDLSEVVVPCLDAAGRVHAVLDADSFEVGAFSVDDALSLRRLLERSGLSVPSDAAVATM